MKSNDKSNLSKIDKFAKYQITPRQLANARAIGVEIRPSSSPDKKLDVYRGGKLVARIGAAGYADFDIYLRTRGREYADERRRLYKIRHAGNRSVKGSPGWYADRILW